MKHRYRITAILWLCLAGLLVWMFFAHGRLIGGVQYFSHMGMGGAAAAELALIAGSLLLARAVWVESPRTTEIALAVAAIALVFALSFWLPLPIIRLFSPMVIPLGWVGVLLPVVVLVFAANTALLPI